MIEFTWIPIYGEQGTAFSIRPAAGKKNEIFKYILNINIFLFLKKGIIEPFKDLECELVWHGSYLAPLKGTFSLQVTGGESNTLSCEAKVINPRFNFLLILNIINIIFILSLGQRNLNS